MAKAKKPNEIREEVRKQMAAKYKQDVEHWKKLANDRWENYMDATKRLADMNDENAKLKEQIEAQSVMAFHVYARTTKVMFDMGVAVELRRLGYNYVKVNAEVVN